MNTGEGARGILVLEHQHDALDRVRIVILAEHAFAFLMAQSRGAEIAHQDGGAVHLLDHDGADLGEGVDEADAADHIALIASGHPAAAGFGIVVVYGVDDVGDTKAKVLELPRLEIQLIFGGEAAKFVSSTTPGTDFNAG